MMGALRSLYHLPGNVISAAVGLLYIKRQPEYELDWFRIIPEVWKNLSWGHCPLAIH